LRKEKIAKYFSVWAVLSGILGLLFFIFSKEITNLFLSFAWDLDNQVKNYAFLYWNILIKYSFLYIFWWMIWQIMIVFQKRKAQIFMASSILIINIILDYIFVKVFNYGVSWIAYATVATWIFILIFGLYYILLKQKITNFTKKLSLENYKIFIKYSLATFFIYILVMWTIMVDNYFFWKIWSEALASYWIGSRLKDIVFYPIIWFSIAFSVLYWFFYWEKDSQTMKEVINYSIKIWLKYALVLLFVMPLIWYLFGWFFSDNELVLKYLMYYMFFSSISMFWYTFEFIYSSAFQVIGFHKVRVFLNILYLIFVFLLEYIFYNLYWTYIAIWTWAVIASLSVSFLTYLYYKVKVEKKE